LLCRLGILAAAVAAFTVVTPVASAQTPAETEPTEEHVEDAQPESEEPETTEPPTGMTSAQKRALALKRKRVLKKIKRFRTVTWRWQKLMRVSRTPASRRAERSPSLAYQRWVLRYWKEQARKARRKAMNPPRKAAWLCIQRHEGAWNANTGNGYYGGLQMDLSFQRTYGPELLRKKGTANRWKPIEQIWVAERAYRSGRGFYPWPNTARYCGLL
jgi:hypothetical protein